MPMRAIAVSMSVAILVAFTACELLTGLGGRVIGIIGYETAAEAESGAIGSRYPPVGPAFDLVASDTAPPWCPDHEHLFEPRCPVLDAPDTVDAGVEFEILVRTVGECREADGAETSRSGMMIEVVPYDRDMWGRAVCPSAPGAFPRTVELVFPEPGDGLIRVTGWVLVVEDSVVDERMGSVEQPVVVR